jgi:tRNA threonylcarbamoyladenosine biosynthesis protein TsaB
MILVLDTATRAPIVAVAQPDGVVVAERRWTSRHRHGEELLERLEEALSEASVARSALTGVVVGTGPGSFTGLRIGLATAKTIAYALGIPIAGVPSTLALALAAASDSDSELTVTLPAGAADRYVHRVGVKAGRPRELAAPRLVASQDVEADSVAVDFEVGTAPAAALERGGAALAALSAALASIGTAMLSDGHTDEVERLVPAYVALPRGIARAAAEMKWSPDLR